MALNLDITMSLDNVLAVAGAAHGSFLLVVLGRGGEPLVHTEADKIVQGIMDQGRYVIICTNALLLPKFLEVEQIQKLLTTPDDFRRIALECCEDLAANGVRYAEAVGKHLTFRLADE